MKVVIQCASSKRLRSGIMKTSLGQKGVEVLFVANPGPCKADRNACKSTSGKVRCVRPDDLCEQEMLTWHEKLRRYNQEQKQDNPYNLSRAAALYTPAQPFSDVYRELADRYEWKNVFILSAGWGLIAADYLIPQYNITFSRQAKKGGCTYTWVNPKSACEDVSRITNHLASTSLSPNEEIHFFCGLDYLGLCYALTKHLPGLKVIHFKSSKLDSGGGLKRDSSFCYEKYGGPEKDRTWPYRAATDFMADQRGAK